LTNLVSGLGLIYESTVLKTLPVPIAAPKLFNQSMPRLNGKCASGASKR